LLLEDFSAKNGIQVKIWQRQTNLGVAVSIISAIDWLFSKEEFFPNTPNKFLFVVGPAIAMSTALMTSAVIPWGDRFHLFGRDILLQATDIDVALLYIFGVVSVGVYGIMIGGWASKNKF
jgi:NADH-quinone oxidoreductase subunit H